MEIILNIILNTTTQCWTFQKDNCFEKLWKPFFTFNNARMSRDILFTAVNTPRNLFKLIHIHALQLCEKTTLMHRVFVKYKSFHRVSKMPFRSLCRFTLYVNILVWNLTSTVSVLLKGTYLLSMSTFNFFVFFSFVFCFIFFFLLFFFFILVFFFFLFCSVFMFAIFFWWRTTCFTTLLSFISHHVASILMSFDVFCRSLVICSIQPLLLHFLFGVLVCKLMSF